MFHLKVGKYSPFTKNMEKIIINPGLQHLTENIFLNLNYKELEACRLLNESCKRILDNPMFWLKKLIRSGLLKKHEKDWMEAIKTTRNTNLETYIVYYLKNCYKEQLVDIPCMKYKSLIARYLFLIKICKIIFIASLKLQAADPQHLI